MTERTAAREPEPGTPHAREAGAAANRLAGESSPYLRSAAHQPVDWYPWGEEAFRRARELDRPILLDIGAVWCHWCHVIDRESYDDPETARLINELFVPVKVDRDERPDIDSRYQLAVSALSGQGGWPLTAFLTPEGKVFYGGTYFPPEDRFGRPGFRSVLRAVAEFYRTQKERAVERAEELHRSLAEHLRSSRRPGPLDADLVEAGIADIRYSYDVAYGGFGRAPKFFHAGALALYLRRYGLTGEAWMRTVVTSTLTHMARGGVYDQLGGGFHRYSVDDRWIVPHFEKMLYDNAALLSVYAEAARATGEALFRRTAEGIVAYYDREGSDRARGGFYASQDADVGPDDDGDYYTWTLEEARAVLDPDEFAVCQLHYNIYQRGEMHFDPARNVLFVDLDPPEIARRLGRPLDEVERLLARGKAKLFAAREARPAPYIDRTILVGWNGMMVAAYLDAWAWLGWRPCRDFAVRTLDRLLAEARAPDGGLYHLLTEEGRGKHEGFLDDQVQVAWAAVRAFETTGEGRFLAAAEQLVDHVHARYWDEADGGCTDLARERTAGPAADGTAVLAEPQKPYHDTPTPAPNAVLARVLVRLFHHTGRERYRDLARRTLAPFAGAARGQGLAAPTYFLALDEYLADPVHVVVVGPRDEATEALHAAALRAWRPGTVVTVVHGGEPGSPAAAPERLPEAVRGM
ncbi:MAG TPA: thioredoxin domain-containing protein, partial [Thermodesulfobacteriota bacterium]|nr:thioredoxin domain-containing protein [Thermodesulfobacteriota bacterium]